MDNEVFLTLLQKETNITEKQLNKKVEQQDLQNLAKLFGGWEMYVNTPGLGLTEGQIAEVRDYAFRKGNIMAVSKALSYWLNINPYHTYRLLIETLIELQQGVLADKVAKSVVDADKKNKGKMTTETNKPHTAPRSTYGLDRKQHILHEVQHHDTNFQNLIVLTLAVLSTIKEEVLTNFKHRLISLPLAIKHEHGNLLASKCSMFKDATTADDILFHLHSHLCFLDFSLLEHIIDHFGSDDLKQQMYAYAQDMRQFRMETTISDIIPHLPQRTDQEGHSKLEFDFDTETTTLEEFDKHRMKYASNFLLSELVVLVTKQKRKKLSSVRNSVPYSSTHISSKIDKEIQTDTSQVQKGETTHLETDQHSALTQQTGDPQQKFAKNHHLQSQNTDFWQVPPDDVITRDDEVLGNGAWGRIVKGVFRGTSVAVKRIHPGILNQATVEKIRREIQIMAQIRHPNLVLFMAAALDEQTGPMIVTELLDTSLRAAYEENSIGPNKRRIFKDISLALAYLHLQRDPIIHRDVSTNNILLIFQPNNTWLAKLSDFGSANLAQYATTLGEGALLYLAPEAYPHPPTSNQPHQPQTTAIDVYSFGVVMCEVVTSTFPVLEKFRDLLKSVGHTWPPIHTLINSCVHSNPVDRPTMSKVLEQIRLLQWEP